jgi:hypothetical protein
VAKRRLLADAEFGEVERCRTVGLVDRRARTYRIVSGRAKNPELATSLPWTWKAAKEAEAASTA